MTLDLSHLLDVFTVEAREYVQSLDVALVALERSSATGALDRAALDEVFRVAHSLKGMCGMMGYQRMAALTHAMEESLLDVRDRGAELDSQRLDTLLACVDALDAAVEEVGRTQQEPAALDALAVRIGLASGPGAATPGELSTASANGRDEPPSGDVDDVVTLVAPPGSTSVRVTLSEDTDLPGVRAFVVLRALERLGQVLHASPSDPTAFEGRVVRAVLGQAEEEEVLAALAPVPEIASVEVETVPDERREPSADQATPGGPARPRVEPTLRVAASRLDDLMFQMQEVVVSSARLEQAVLDAGSKQLRQQMAELLQHAQRLQTSVMQVRMTPLEATFARVPRLVRDLSQRLGKDVQLVLAGGDTEVDRSMVDNLADPLVHLVRNALDHGIEPPEDRVRAGKPARATLAMSAEHAGGHVVIEVRDDGRGIDAARVAAKAVERGTITQAEVDHARAAGDLLDLVFRPGVSSAETVTDISGRGVGLDAVRTTMRELAGDLSIETEPGRSTTVQLRLPLTLAIMPALLVRSGDVDVAIPLDRIARITRIADGATRSVLGQRVLSTDAGATISLLDLATALGHGAGADAARQARHAVIAHVPEGMIALAVDEVRGTRDIATRALPSAYAADDVPLLGVGMLPDGSLATIVDCDALARSAAGQQRTESEEPAS